MKDFLIAFIISILAVFSPIKPLLLTTGFLIAADFIFGVYKAYRQDPKSITSRKMGHTISKILLYNLAIISVYLIEHFILSDQLPLAKIVSGIICITELKSIDESFKIAFGFSFYDRLIGIIKRGTSQTKDVLPGEVDE